MAGSGCQVVIKVATMRQWRSPDFAGARHVNGWPQCKRRAAHRMFSWPGHPRRLNVTEQMA